MSNGLLSAQPGLSAGPAQNTILRPPTSCLKPFAGLTWASCSAREAGSGPLHIVEPPVGFRPPVITSLRLCRFAAIA